MTHQTINTKRARADGGIAPCVLRLLTMVNLIVQPALRAGRRGRYEAGADHSGGQKAGANRLASHSELQCGEYGWYLMWLNNPSKKLCVGCLNKPEYRVVRLKAAMNHYGLKPKDIKGVVPTLKGL